MPKRFLVLLIAITLGVLYTNPRLPPGTWRDIGLLFHKTFVEDWKETTLSFALLLLAVLAIAGVVIRVNKSLNPP